MPTSRPSACAPRWRRSSPRTRCRSPSASAWRATRATAASADAVIGRPTRRCTPPRRWGATARSSSTRDLCDLRPRGRRRGDDGAHLATLLSLTEALDIRDAGTADHSRTVGRYSALIAAELGLSPTRRADEVAGRAPRHRQDRAAGRGAPEARPARGRRAGRDAHASGDRRGGPRPARARGHAQLGPSPTTSAPTARATRRG